LSVQHSHGSKAEHEPPSLLSLRSQYYPGSNRFIATGGRAGTAVSSNALFVLGTVTDDSFTQRSWIQTINTTSNTLVTPGKLLGTQFFFSRSKALTRDPVSGDLFFVADIAKTAADNQNSNVDIAVTRYGSLGFLFLKGH
jgi:hypothetical protein